MFKLPDSATYFLSHWERILDRDFLPLGEDIVRWPQYGRTAPILILGNVFSGLGKSRFYGRHECRMRRATSGVSETILPFGDIYFTLVDVGGQRSERRKWYNLSPPFLDSKTETSLWPGSTVLRTSPQSSSSPLWPSTT